MWMRGNGLGFHWSCANKVSVSVSLAFMTNCPFGAHTSHLDAIVECFKARVENH